MKSLANASSNISKSKALPLAVITIVIVAVVGLVWAAVAMYGSSLTKSTTNRAEEVAKPLEDALTNAGGIKKTSGGDGGHGTDNAEPYYDVTYEMPLDKEKTIALANKVAEDNGYKLTHASPGNRGHLGVADVYLDAWYFDNTSKNSAFSDLEDGPTRLAFKVGDEDHPDPADRTTLRISLRLPNTKR